MFKTNKMWIFLILVFIVLIATGCAGGDKAVDTDNAEANTEGSKVTLKLAHQWAAPTDEENDYRSELAERFAEEVDKASNGEIEVKVYPSNSLASPDEQFSSLQKGSLDLAIWAPFYEAGKVPEFSITLMPGIIQSFDQAWQWSDEEVGDELDDLLEENGVKNLVYAWGTMAIGTKGNNKVIHPEDVDDLLFRGAGKDSEKLLESSGAGIVSMDSSEIYGALQTNVLDGTLTSFDSFLSYGLFEVLDHFNYTGENAFMYSMNPLVMSDKSWEEKLTKDQQKIIEDVSNDLEGWVKEAAIESNSDIVEVFRENDVEVHEMSEEESKEWFEASQPIVEEFAETSDRASRLVELARELHTD